jgi:molybdate transport system substrate-binding protein
MLLVLAVIGLLASLPSLAGPTPRSVTVFAAASLADALTKVSQRFESSTGVHVTLSFASSAQLARQIESGGPADLFISADQAWMDYLSVHGLLKSDTRRNLLTNRLALIGTCEPRSHLKISPHFALGQAVAGSRLAIADPDSVPAGRYARTALITLGVWSEVSARLLPAVDVRGALMYVDRGEATFGIVYATDAAIDHRICIIDIFPEDSHPPIVYPMALTRESAPDGARLAAFLRQPESRAIFETFGFGMAP